MPNNHHETNSSSSRYNVDNPELHLQPALSFSDTDFLTDLHLSVAPSQTSAEMEEKDRAMKLQEFAGEQLRLAAVEKAFAEEARKKSRRQVEMAEQELANAQRIRMQAQAELERAHALKEEALRKIASTITHVTCTACERQFLAAPTAPQPSDEISAQSLVSSATTVTEGEG